MVFSSHHFLLSTHANAQFKSCPRLNLRLSLDCSATTTHSSSALNIKPRRANSAESCASRPVPSSRKGTSTASLAGGRDADEPFEATARSGGSLTVTNGEVVVCGGGGIEVPTPSPHLPSPFPETLHVTSPAKLSSPSNRGESGVSSRCSVTLMPEMTTRQRGRAPWTVGVVMIPWTEKYTKSFV